MPESYEIKIFPRDRRRQFVDVRKSHSRHKDLSQSQLSKSVGKSRINRQFFNERETSRFTNIENEESRVLKQSKFSQNNQGSKSDKKLMCLCCYNKKQAECKQTRRNRQKFIQQQQIKDMKQSIIQSNLYKQMLHQSHVRHSIEQMNDYNKKLAERRQQQKLNQLNQKKYEGQITKMQKQNFEMQKQNRLRHSLQLRNMLKQKYEEQIKIKQEKQDKSKKINQSLDRNIIVDAIIPKNYHKSAVQTIRVAYKQELLKQIEQKQIQKKKQIQDYKGLSAQNIKNEFDLVTFAQNRNQQARKYANQLKQNTLNDMNQKKNQQKFTKQQLQIQRQQKQRQRKQNILQLQTQKIHQQQIRRQKIDNYLCDLKSQIQQNKKKRLQQLQWINQRKLGQPIIKTKQIPQYDKQSCQGCHKKYPKKMLSQFVTIID